GEVKIHRLDAQQKLDEDGRRLLGDNPFYVAVRSDALFLAGGEGGLQALKEAVAGKAGPAPSAQLDVSVSRLVPLMGKKAKMDPAEAARKAFGEGARDNDKLRFTVQGGEAFKVRLSMNAAVLKFFSLVNPKNTGD